MDYDQLEQYAGIDSLDSIVGKIFFVALIRPTRTIHMRKLKHLPKHT